MSNRYILNGKTPVPCDDLLTWIEWFKKVGNRIAITYLDGIPTFGPRGARHCINSMVTTIFTGIDHSRGKDNPPLLFETYVFKGPLDQEMDRYATWEEAEEGHKAMVQKVKEAIKCKKQIKTQH